MVVAELVVSCLLVLDLVVAEVVSCSFILVVVGVGRVGLVGLVGCVGRVGVVGVLLVVGDWFVVVVVVPRISFGVKHLRINIYSEYMFS